MSSMIPVEMRTGGFYNGIDAAEDRMHDVALVDTRCVVETRRRRTPRRIDGSG